MHDYLRNQNGLLGALFQGGDEEGRAARFEARRDEYPKMIEDVNAAFASTDDPSTQNSLVNSIVREMLGLSKSIIESSNTPQLPIDEKMAPWMSQYRWFFRQYLEDSGVSPFSVALKVEWGTVTQEIKREGVKYSKTHKFMLASPSISPEPQKLTIPANLYDAAKKSGVFRRQT